MRLLKCEKGIAIPLVLMVMVVLLLLGTALWQYAINDLKQVAHAEDKARAYYVARSGAETLATHIMHEPRVIDDILSANQQNISGVHTLESEYLGKAGDMEVSLEELGNDEYKITGIGEANEVRQTASIVMKVSVFPVTDAVCIVTGTQHVEFHENMTVKGSIVAGGPVTVPNNYDHNAYTVEDNYSFPENYFSRVEVPDGPYDHEHNGTLQLNNPNSAPLEIPAGEIYKVEELRTNHHGEIIFNSPEGTTTELVVGKLNMTGGKIKIEGSGTAIIYLTGDSSLRNPKVETPQGAQLHFFLGEDVDEPTELSLNGNVEFNGLIYGPYGSHVKMQSGGKIHGAVVTEKLSGMGGDNHVGAAQAALEYLEGLEALNFPEIVRMLYWVP